MDHIKFIPGDDKEQLADRYFVANRLNEGEKRDQEAPERVNPRWIEHNFNAHYIALLKRCPHQWIPVVAGAADNKVAPPNLTVSGISLKFKQGSRDFCLFFSVANGLRYCKFHEAANLIKLNAAKGSKLPQDMAVDLLRKLVEKGAPSIGVGPVFTRKKTQRYQSKEMDIETLVNEQTPFPTIVIPRGMDGSIAHAVCVVDDLIFDSTQNYALKLSRETFDWIVGGKGVVSIHYAASFERRVSKKNTPYKRKMKVNW